MALDCSPKSFYKLIIGITWKLGMPLMTPRGGDLFWPLGHILDKFRRGPLDDATYQISRI